MGKKHTGLSLVQKSEFKHTLQGILKIDLP